MDLGRPLNPVTGVYVRKEDTQKQREEGDVKAKAETRVMCLQAEEAQSLPANPQKPGERREQTG